MAKDNVVMIRAKIENANIDRTQWKPYSTTLTFPDGLYIHIPVPREHVIKENKDGSVDLSVEGWTIFQDGYATAVEKMNTKWVQSFQKPGQHRPLF